MYHGWLRIAIIKHGKLWYNWADIQWCSVYSLLVVSGGACLIDGRNFSPVPAFIQVNGSVSQGRDDAGSQTQ